MGSNGKTGKLNAQQLAHFLGWFSIGLGVAEVVAPRQLGRLIGIRGRRGLLRMFGLREIASGIGILTQHQPGSWVWSRVGGDMMDLAALGMAMRNDSARPSRIAVATAAVAGVTALDVLCGQELCRDTKVSDGATHVEKSVIVDRSPEEVYRFWRDFKNLPRFMQHLMSVEEISATQSHWIAKGPAGAAVEWNAEIINDKPNELISWRSLENSDVDNAGSVRFERAPGNRGTIVRVKLQYRPMGGKLGAMVAKLFGQAPEKQIKVDLYRFKQVLETGEIARTEGQPSGRSRSTSRKYDDFVRA